jgi:hypothetical protein
MTRLLSLFSSLRKRPAVRTKTHQRRGVRPALERLEDRLTPAVTWTGGAGTLNWSDAANWSGGAVPGAADDAIINIPVSGPIKISGTNAVHSLTDTTASLVLPGGSLSLAAASSVSQNVTLQGGTLTAAGSLVVGGALTESNGLLNGGGTVTVNGLLTWTGGTMSGTGTTAAAGGLQLGQSGQSDNETLDGRTLTNAGAATLMDQNGLTQQHGSVVRNLAGGTLNLGAGEVWTGDVGSRFDNAGTVNVSAGTATNKEYVFLNNTGKVSVNSGTLDLGGSGAGTGTFSAASGATLQFGTYSYTDYAFNAGAVVGGPGTIQFGPNVAAQFASGATIKVTGSTVIDSGGNTDTNIVFAAGSKVQSVGALTIKTGVLNFSTGSPVTVASLTQSDGTLTGSDAVTISGLTAWTGGTMSGTGSTVAAGGLQLGSTDGAYHIETVECRTVTNTRTANWTGAGEIDLFSGATFNNQAGATFNDLTARTIWTDVGVGLYPSGRFNNQGAFNVSAGAGTAGMQAPFFNTGSVVINSGTWNLSSKGTATGTFTVNAGATFDFNAYYVGGVVRGAGNVVRTTGSNVSPVAITGGAVNISTTGQHFYRVDGNVTVSSLHMTSGYLVVEGTLTVNGPMTWTGGYIVGPGTVKVLGALQLGANDGVTGNYESLYGATLINSGSANMYDSFAQQYGSTFVNLPGASLNLLSNGTWNSDGTATLVNQGTLKKSAGTGASVIDYVTLVNSGSVAANSGTLNLQGDGTATGSFTAAAGATLEFGHGYWGFNAGSSVSGAGTVEFPFDYWLSAFNSGSTYNVAGATAVDSAAVVFLPGSQIKNVGTLTLGGNAVWTTAGALP